MIAIIGMGFMGRTHAAAYEALRRVGYPAVIKGVWSTGPDAPSDWPTYRSLDLLLADTGVQAVSICTHTDSHVELAKRALAAGKHVLVEKPVALDVRSIRELEAARDHASRVVLPGFCMRFWPGWSWLKDRIVAGDFGAPRRARFVRTGAKPAWSPFYDDDRRSGNALFDLHIHDADFIRWCLGEPGSVSSAGSVRHLTTTYRLEQVEGPVVAEGGWLPEPSAPFSMRYTVELEGAVVDFDLGRDPPVLLTRAGRTETVGFPAATAYELQARHFLDLVAGRQSVPVATLDDAARVTELLLAERTSVESGLAVEIGVAGRPTGR